MLKNKKLSLQKKTIIYTLISIIFCAVLYGAITLIGEVVVDNFYMSDEKIEAREKATADEFSAFVKDNNIKSDDFNQIKAWCNDNEQTYIMIYKNHYLVYSTDGSFESTYDEGDEPIDKNDNEYKISFADNDKDFSYTIYEYSEAEIYSTINITSFLFCIILLLILIIYYTGKIVAKVTALSKAVEETSADNTKEIAVTSGDEFGVLQQKINEMRLSIIKHYENEKEAIDSNNKLITNISHDIRTPLTAILGYSEIMASENVTDIDEIKKYAENCEQKAYQLKTLTDELFKYFLIYTKETTEVNKEKLPANTLLQQIIGENALYLEQQGFSFSVDNDGKDAQIDVDPNLFRRLFDNLFTNIGKYADKNYPIIISKKIANNMLLIEVSNQISTVEKPESSKLGLQICTKIMELLNGKFEIKTDNDTFTAKITISICDI